MLHEFAEGREAIVSLASQLGERELERLDREKAAYQAENPGKEIKIIRVRAPVKRTLDGGHSVVLSERFWGHPQVEAYITTDGKTHEVARSPRVNSLLLEGRLIEVKDEKKK